MYFYYSLEVTTQDAVTPSFSISSALREPDQLGSEVYEELVGEEIWWTIDIPSKMCLLWTTSRENLFMSYANKCADQPAHPRSDQRL